MLNKSWNWHNFHIFDSAHSLNIFKLKQSEVIEVNTFSFYSSAFIKKIRVISLGMSSIDPFLETVWNKTDRLLFNHILIASFDIYCAAGAQRYKKNPI